MSSHPGPHQPFICSAMTRVKLTVGVNVTLKRAADERCDVHWAATTSNHEDKELNRTQQSSFHLLYITTQHRGAHYAHAGWNKWPGRGLMVCSATHSTNTDYTLSVFPPSCSCCSALTLETLSLSQHRNHSVQWLLRLFPPTSFFFLSIFFSVRQTPEASLRQQDMATRLSFTLVQKVCVCYFCQIDGHTKVSPGAGVKGGGGWVERETHLLFDGAQQLLTSLCLWNTTRTDTRDMFDLIVLAAKHSIFQGKENFCGHGIYILYILFCSHLPWLLPWVPCPVSLFSAERAAPLVHPRYHDSTSRRAHAS